MSLLVSKHDVELPFEAEHVETYALPNNVLLVFNEAWDYFMWDGLRGKIMYQGKFPEAEEHSSILSIYSYWFTQISAEKILYYSPTDNRLKVYNFQTASIVSEWKGTFKINPEFNFFDWIVYYKDERKARVLHMIEFSKAAVDDIDEETGEVTRVGTVDLINGNCICEHEQTLLYATQANESSPLVINTLTKTHMQKITFNYDVNVTPIEFGFIREDLLFILYNSNDKPDSGIFLVNIGSHDFTSDLSISDSADNCTKIILQGEDDPDIFDGRIIVDKVLQTITITGMNQIRVYQLSEENGKYKATKTESKELKETPDNAPLNRESLTCFDYDFNTNMCTIGFYRATDTRCLYMWILQQSKIADEYNPAILKELIDVLV